MIKARIIYKDKKYKRFLSLQFVASKTLFSFYRRVSRPISIWYDKRKIRRGITVERTQKQQFMSYYNNEPMERFPNFMTDTNPLFKITGFNERPQQTGKDWFGCDWIYDPVNDCCVQDVSKPSVLEDIEDWKKVLVFPDLKAEDWEKNAKADGVDQFDPNKANYYIIDQGLFERLHSLMGFENAMCAMLTNPEDVGELFDRITDMKLEMLEILAKYYHLDVVNYMDDWGTQLDLFFSPDTWRELIKPRTKKIVDKCHELGMKFELHCCGKIERLIPEIAEIGVDSLQCMGINDIPAMKKITGDKMGYTVSPRYQKISALDEMGQLTKEKVTELLEEEIREEAVGGRYYSFFWPAKSWWTPIVFKVIERMGYEVYKK
jgi:hypothetical protein